MPSSKSASTCTTLEKVISLLPKGSSATSRAPWTMAWSFRGHLRHSSLSTPTLTGLAVQTPAVLPRAMQSSSAAASSPGHPSGSPPSPAPVRRLNIVQLQMALLKLPGYINSSRNFITPCHQPASSIATMSAPSTSPPTPYNTSVPNTWRSISTSYGNALPLGLFGSSMSPPHPNLLTSSPRVFLHPSSLIFAPV